MTDEQLALLIDPKRELHPHWWRYAFVGENASGCTIAGDPEMAESPLWQPTGDPSGNTPPLTTDRIAAATHVTPVLLTCGWIVTESQCGTWVQDQDGVTIEHNESYPAATTAAIAWLAEHEPERLRKAVEVRPC